MKKIKTLFVLLGGLLPITACSFGNFVSAFQSFSSETSTSQESSSESEIQQSSTVTSSSSSSTVVIPDYRLESIDVDEYSTEFYTGYTFIEQCNFEVFAYYDDGGCELIDNSLITAQLVSMRSGNHIVKDGEPIGFAGLYDIVLNVSYTEFDVTVTNTLTLSKEIKSILETGTKEPKGIELISYEEFIVGVTPIERLKGELKIIWEDNTFECITFDKNTDGIELVVTTDKSLQDISNRPMVGDVNYKFVIKYKGFAVEFEVKLEGYTRVDADEFKFTMSDWDKYVSQPKGKNMMLVIPITLSGSGSFENWTDRKIEKLRASLFGDEGRTLVTYYSAASFDEVTFDGFISDVYVETSLTTDSVLAGTEKLHQLLNNSFNWVKSNHADDINWADFDINADGYVDNVYFATNYISNQWSDNLWPHKSTISGNIGQNLDLNNPVPYQYILSNSAYVDDGTVAVHEQGHAFGLADYYDYSSGSGSNINYVGCADMQSHNMFDWNSYSKLSVGWVDPIVVTGNSSEVTISIRAAATTGDCILIPANYSTWNKSAFDEYFLIELFSPKGLNKDDWQIWSKYYNNLGNYGIRLYHVDSRLFEVEEPYGTGQEIDYDKLLTGYYDDKYIITGANNSSDYTAPNYGTYNPKACKDFKQLTLIQKGGVDTFGANDNKTDFLGAGDLFKTGDIFTFSKYSHFLSKTGKTRTNTNKGEVFPYTIEFVSVTADEATIKISK